jgi:hypothetical protein
VFLLLPVRPADDVEVKVRFMSIALIVRVMEKNIVAIVGEPG